MAVHAVLHEDLDADHKLVALLDGLDVAEFDDLLCVCAEDLGVEAQVVLRQIEAALKQHGLAQRAGPVVDQHLVGRQFEL